MPIFNEVSLRRPVILNSLTSFRYSAPISVEESPITAGSYALNGDLSSRGAVYLEGAEGEPTVVLLRNAYGNQSEIAKYYNFQADLVTKLGPTSSQPAQVNSIITIDNNYWQLGTNQFNGAHIVKKVPNGTLTSPSTGWSVLDSDSPYGGAASAYFMRKAADQERLYCLIHHTTGSNELMVMRSTDLAGSTFDDITVTPRTSAVGPTAYGVRDDGQTQLMAYGTSSEGRSTDGGVTWSSLSIGIDGITDILYCKASERWVATAPLTATTPGVRFSSNDGVAWSDARLRGSTTGGSTLLRFSHIEKLDPEGRYLLGIRGYSAPIRTYISEDGGANWLFSQNLITPWYDVAPQFNQLVLVNTGSRILLYQGAYSGGVPEWNFDNAVFESGLTGLEVTTL